jgi:hypothetical protein
MPKTHRVDGGLFDWAEDQDIVIGSVGPESVEAGILDDLLVRRANLPGGTGTQLV